MATKKKSWQEKLKDSKDLPKVVKIEGKMSKRWLAGRSLGEGRGTGTCAIASPMEVNNFMAKVPKGKVTTINELRSAIAKKHQATIGCPITTGIFAWISANAAEEARGEGKKRITPWWRTLKGEGELNPKYPGGAQQQKTFLENECIKVAQKGKKYKVEDLEKIIYKF